MKWENKKRIMAEIIQPIVEDLVAAGYEVGVDYERGFDPQIRTTKWEEAKEKLFACDEEWLMVFKPGEKKAHYFVYLVYCNEPGEVVSDYSCAIEKQLERSNKIADGYM